MSKFKYAIFVSIFFHLAANASVVYAAPRGNGIDQKPMYGGMDRSAYPKLKKGDDVLIAGVVKEFGSREKASQAFVEQGIRFYQSDDYSKAMKRFNQAWLLDPKNPDVFWGFAIIFYDEENLPEAKNMIDKAIELNLSNPTALADAGRIYVLYAFEGNDPSVDKAAKRQYAKKSDELYEKALKGAPGYGYIYESWASALYYEGEYARSWEKVSEARQVGYVPSAWLLNHLREKMAEPKS